MPRFWQVLIAPGPDSGAGYSRCSNVPGEVRVRLGQWLGLLAIAAASYILWQLRQALLLIFSAVVLAVVLNSFSRWLAGHTGLGRRRSVLLTMLLTLVGLVIGLLVVLPPFFGQVQELLRILPASLATMLLWLQQLVSEVVQRLPLGLSDDQRSLAFVQEQTAQLLTLLQEQRTWSQFAPLAGNVVGALNATLAGLLQGLIVLVLSLMFLADPPTYRRLLLRLCPSFYRRRADAVLGAIEAALTDWAGGVLLSSTAIALLSGLVLWALGLKLVFSNALLAGVLNLIPNFGPTLSAVFPMAVALLDAPWKVWAVLGSYIVIQQMESYLITPAIMARQVSLPPAITLIAQLTFASLFGVAGLVLALPLAVVCQVCVREMLVRDLLDPWHSVRPWTHADLEAEATPLSGSDDRG